MNVSVARTFLALLLLCGFAVSSSADETRRLVLVAGKPSHPPRMHEFNAGVQVIAKCLANVPGLKVDVVLNGWPKDESLFTGANAAVFYMDGGGKHELVLENGRRLALINDLIEKGLNVGCMHYGVEVIPDQAGTEFKKWIGGHYENMFSCNPLWEPEFTSFPKHPVTNGVKPFHIKDEWYFNIRFLSNLDGRSAAKVDDVTFTPILIAEPSDSTRNGPYVYPQGPYAHVQENKGKAEAMMWTIERPEGHRGFGFTGGHYHDNWGNDNFRKVVLNALVWLTGAQVPPDGIESSVTSEELDLNLDPKPAKK